MVGSKKSRITPALRVREVFLHDHLGVALHPAQRQVLLLAHLDIGPARPPVTPSKTRTPKLVY
jgi:hypothetical protein